MTRRGLHLAAEAAVSPCSSHVTALLQGSRAHGDAHLLLVDEIEGSPDPFRFSSVISALSKSESPRDASSVLSLFRRMLGAGHPPSCFAFPSVLKACATLRSFLAGLQVHALASACGCASEDPFVQTSLVHMYLRCGRPADARRVFERMTSPSVVSWSALIGGYARAGCAAEAASTLDRMLASGTKPNRATWNGMIAGFSSSGLSLESVRALRRMHSEDLGPDGTSFSSVLPAVAELGDGLAGMQAHAYTIKLGLAAADDCVATALVAMYGKCRLADEMMRAFDDGTSLGEETDVGSCNALVSGLSLNNRADEALRRFREFQRRGVRLNVVSWTSIVACCAQNGEDAPALRLFGEMQTAGVSPNSVTISCLLPACANIAALRPGKSVHAFSLRHAMIDVVHVRSALVDMYAKCGRIEDARLVFEQASFRNVVSWNAMLGGYAMHGMAGDAIELFDEMRSRGQKPDAITFTCLLAACSQAGLTRQGLDYFHAMPEIYGVPRRTEHYACVVSLLGRAGKTKRAYALIRGMPLRPDACVWGALLGACKLHGDVALGEIAARALFKLEPGNVGNYVLLSQIYYAAGGMQAAGDEVRERMKATGLRKNPGCSWIELKDGVHALLAGERSHPQMARILERLRGLGAEMWRLGHRPSTELVLQDVEEQDKEHILCGHSEKLAVALGLLSTPPGTPIRVIKNLRICADCHAAIKLISFLEKRQILVRDTNRFHHFSLGGCSCGDYW